MTLEADGPKWPDRVNQSTSMVFGPLLIMTILMAGCSMTPAERTDRPTTTSATAASTTAPGTHGAPSTPAGSAPQTVSFKELLDDPERFVGQPLEVVGKAFFLAECPPPGDIPAACVLNGYLAAPDRGVLIAADLPEAIVLAEGGRSLSCDEGAESPPACGDWRAATRYDVVGVLEPRVLGGRDTNLLQLNVLSKTPLP